MEEQVQETKPAGIYKKLFNVQQAGLKFTKDKKGVHNAKYVTLDNLNETLLPVLKKENLVIAHNTIANQNGGYKVQTMVIDVTDGSMVASAFPLQSDLEPQKAGSAISYAKRYNIGQLLNIITDEDDDGEAASPDNVKKANRL